MKLYFPEMSEECRNAYLLGYRAGYQDALAGKDNKPENIPADPIEVLALSTKTYNCLRHAGLRYVSDVAALTAENIYRMRNLGKVTANEVATALQSFGIHGTDWDLFLL